MKTNVLDESFIRPEARCAEYAGQPEARFVVKLGSGGIFLTSMQHIVAVHQRGALLCPKCSDLNAAKHSIRNWKNPDF